MIPALYLGYLVILSGLTSGVLRLIAWFRATKVSEEEILIGTLLTIGSSLWSVIFVLRDAQENIPKAISGFYIALNFFLGLFALNALGLLVMLAFLGLMGLPLWINTDKLMRIYEMEDKQKAINLLGTCLLLSNIGISAGLLVFEYISFLKTSGEL